MKKRILVILCVLAAHLAISQQGTLSVQHNPSSLNQSDGDIACRIVVNYSLYAKDKSLLMDLTWTVTTGDYLIAQQKKYTRQQLGADVFSQIQIQKIIQCEADVFYQGAKIGRIDFDGSTCSNSTNNNPGVCTGQPVEVGNDNEKARQFPGKNIGELKKIWQNVQFSNFRIKSSNTGSNVPRIWKPYPLVNDAIKKFEGGKPTTETKNQNTGTSKSTSTGINNQTSSSSSNDGSNNLTIIKKNEKKSEDAETIKLQQAINESNRRKEEAYKNLEASTTSFINGLNVVFGNRETRAEREARLVDEEKRKELRRENTERGINHRKDAAIAETAELFDNIKPSETEFKNATVIHYNQAAWDVPLTVYSKPETQFTYSASKKGGNYTLNDMIALLGSPISDIERICFNSKNYNAELLSILELIDTSSLITYASLHHLLYNKKVTRKGQLENIKIKPSDSAKVIAEAEDLIHYRLLYKYLYHNDIKAGKLGGGWDLDIINFNRSSYSQEDLNKGNKGAINKLLIQDNKVIGVSQIVERRNLSLNLIKAGWNFYKKVPGRKPNLNEAMRYLGPVELERGFQREYADLYLNVLMPGVFVAVVANGSTSKLSVYSYNSAVPELNTAIKEVMLFKRGNAIEIINRLLDTNPYNPLAIALRMFIYEELGMRDKAAADEELYRSLEE